MNGIYLVCFGNNTYVASRKRLVKSANKYGINNIFEYNIFNIKCTAFYWKHKYIFSFPRGAGYWLWKPFIINQSLKKIPENSILIYSDAGIEIINNLEPLINLVNHKNPVLLFGVHDRPDCINRYWTKRDCFIRMNCDTEDFYDSRQSMGGFQLYYNCPEARNFVSEWLSYCCDPHILTDIPNISGQPNLEGFIDHRHDQSILSILRCKHNIELFRDPSQFGNHMKKNEIRVAGEWLAHPYTKEPYLNSDYNTLLNHHRQKIITLETKITIKVKNILNKIKKI
jgi:hypothetical protein